MRREDAMTLQRFCRKSVATARPDDSVATAAAKMAEHHVGALVVIDGREHPIGILTDRDVVIRVVAQGRDPAATPVSVVMTREPEVVEIGEKLDHVAFTMRSKGVRRLPIVSDMGHLVGIVTVDDLTVLFAGELSQTAMAMRENAGP